ncbi:MAG: cyclase family protein [Marinilabiliaceae bacterium]|nr:cyclase family protein [Marinilabiliaceae bacterium]
MKITRIIDLTHTISERMPMYPGTEAPKLNVAFPHAEYGFMETQLTLFSHTGTHIDAPLHLFENGFSLDDYHIEQFVGKALVIDCRKVAKGKQITMQLLEDKRKDLYAADFILFNTGHSALWGKQEYFCNFPTLSSYVVDWINMRKLKGIGIDAPSFDPITTEDLNTAATELKIHCKILKTNYTIFLENLCNLEKVGNKLFTLCALPLKIEKADGAPARVVAIV